MNNQKIEDIKVLKYGLTIIVKNKEDEEYVKAKIEQLTEDHHSNFQAMAALIDQGKIEITRELTEDENDKVMDKHISGNYDDSEHLEKTFKGQWETEIIKYLK